MAEIGINLVNSVLDKVRIYTLTNESVIANMLCFFVGNDLEVSKDEILDGSNISSEKLEAALLSRIPIDNKTVYNALKSLLAHKVNVEVLDILASEILGNTIWINSQQVAIEYLIDVILCEQLEPEIQTPAWLNRLAIALLNPVEGDFYDGVAGSCGTAVEVYRHSQKENGEIAIYTQEVNEFLYIVSVVRTFLEGIPNIFHACGDTIRNPVYQKNGKLQTFDSSIMFPPLGMMKSVDETLLGDDRFNRFFRSTSARIGWDWAFALHQIASLNECGKGVLCMFSGALFNAQSKLIRSEIIQSGIIECIIAIPANSLSFSAVPINLVVFNKNLKRNSHILMIDALKLMQANTITSYKKRFVLNEDGIQKITKIYTNKIEDAQISKVVPISKLVDADLMPTRYIKKTLFEAPEFGTILVSPNIDDILMNVNWKPIKDVAEIQVGVNNFKVAEQSDEGSIKIIKLSDVQSGTLNIQDMEKYRLTKYVNLEKYRVHSNDVLLSCKGPAVKTCMIPQTDEYLVASSNFVTLRADPRMILPHYLKYYLESPMGMYFVKSKQVGSSIVMINTKEVNAIPIPYIPLPEQMKLVCELQSKERYIQEEIFKLSQMLRKSKLDFYNNIGLMDVMTVIEEDQK